MGILGKHASVQYSTIIISFKMKLEDNWKVLLVRTAYFPIIIHIKYL